MFAWILLCVRPWTFSFEQNRHHSCSLRTYILVERDGQQASEWINRIISERGKCSEGKTTWQSDQFGAGDGLLHFEWLEVVGLKRWQKLSDSLLSILASVPAEEATPWPASPFSSYLRYVVSFFNASATLCLLLSFLVCLIPPIEKALADVSKGYQVPCPNDSPSLLQIY